MFVAVGISSRSAGASGGTDHLDGFTLPQRMSASSIKYLNCVEEFDCSL